MLRIGTRLRAGRAQHADRGRAAVRRHRDTGGVRADQRQDAFQLALADAELGQVPQRADQVVEVDAGDAPRPADQARLHGERQLPRVARVRPLDDVGERHHLPVFALGDLDRQMRLAIDAVDLLARAQIGDGGCRVRRADAIDDAGAGAAAVEPQHHAGPFGRAAMMHGVDAEAAAIADHAGAPRFLEGKAWPPHQRSVAEHPQIVMRDAHDPEGFLSAARDPSQRCRAAGRSRERRCPGRPG